jgi:hypothetical protein
LLAGAALVLACAPAARADQLRLHYVVVGQNGGAVLQATPAGPQVQRSNLFGLIREPSPRPLRTNYVVTFRHYYTAQLVTVPVAFPEGTPRLEYRVNRIIYNYGSYTVEAIFNPDGSVDMLYNSGFFRPVQP